MGMQFQRFVFTALLSVCISESVNAFTIEDVAFDTQLGLQTRIYDNDPVSPIQRRHEFSTVYFQQAISYSWNNKKDNWVFNPYLSVTRYEDPWKVKHEGNVPFIVPMPIIDFGDTRTAHRIHGDISEFLWTHINNDNSWELRSGIGKVFWGVTESQHLVDVINQDNLRADIDREDKLGQPMINLTLVQRWGNFDLFILPGFRERVYQDNIGRLNPVVVADPYSAPSGTNPIFMIDQDADALFESGADELHTDFAIRWSHNIGVNDFALSFFQGTNREPITNPLSNPVRTSTLYPGVNFITPYYEQMNQVGVEYQATLGRWLLKFEGIYRDSDSPKTPEQDKLDGKTSPTEDFTAFTGGFEYTFAGIFENSADLGVLVEFHNDSRDFEATSLYQNDVFFGFRYSKNSATDPNILFGVIQDLDVDSYIGFFEASRRVGQNRRLIFEGMTGYADGQAPADIDAGRDITTSLSNEEHVRLAWEVYF